jgi:hypothetical protein
MNALRRVRPRAWGALGLSGLLLIIGLGGHGLRQDRERLTRVLRLERELREMVEGVRSEQAWLDRQLIRPLDDPRTLLDTYAPGERIRIATQTSESLSGTVRLRRAELRIEGVSWEKLHEVIHAFETQTPPWRMGRFEVKSTLTGLEGEVVFEGLETGD